MSIEILHGDCARVLTDYLEVADLVITSPPYGDMRTYGGHDFDFDAVADAIERSLKPGGVLVWVIGDAFRRGSYTGTQYRHALGFLERGLNLYDHMSFQKTRKMPRGPRAYLSDWESMYVFVNGTPRVFNPICDRPNKTAGSMRRFKECGRRLDTPQKRLDGAYRVTSHSRRTNTWEFHTGSGADGGFWRAFEHPAIFPYKLALDHILTWTDEGDFVLDPMCGSGTVLAAALNSGRNGLGIDIHEPYVKLARDRVAQLGF